MGLSWIPTGHALSWPPCTTGYQPMRSAPWAAPSTPSQAAQASINFGVYSDEGIQVGYSRVFTDTVSFGWLCDVYLARHVRGRGLGTALLEVIVDAIRSLGLDRFMLSAVDAHDLYAQTGFKSFPDPQKLMILGPNEE